MSTEPTFRARVKDEHGVADTWFAGRVPVWGECVKWNGVYRRIDQVVHEPGTRLAPMLVLE